VVLPEFVVLWLDGWEAELSEDVLEVRTKRWSGETANVLEKDGSWAEGAYGSEDFREEVSAVLFREVFAPRD
jgi:hypothetical protein